MTKENISSPLKYYKSMGKRYGLINDDKNIHLFYSRPNLLSLFPPSVSSMKRVLDLGCGTGYFGYQAQEIWPNSLVDYLDGNEDLLEMAKERVGKRRANFICHDLNQKMAFYKDETFDLVVSSLVVHYIENWKELFLEIARILRPGGLFIFSTHNPVLELFYLKMDNYFDQKLVKENWGDLGSVSFYHHTVETLWQSSLNAKFSLVQYLEPKPLKELKKIEPKLFYNLNSRPHFLFIKLMKIE